MASPAAASLPENNASGEQEQQEAEGTPRVQQSPLAIHNRALMYYRGDGVQTSHEKALAYYRQAAEQGHAASMIMTGFMLENGQGTERNYTAAMEWYRRAADMGFASAQLAIGDLYRFGRGVSRDDAEAVSWYERAAAQRLPEALCRLGYMTVRGRGVTRDLKKAAALLEDGANQNNACSQHYLAFMHMNGLVGMLPNTKRALELDWQAAGGGNAEAQFNMGKAHEIGWVELATELDALNWYMLSAANGYPLAMERLVTVFERGQLKQDISAEKARMWRERASTAWKNWPEPRPGAIEKIRFMPQK